MANSSGALLNEQYDVPEEERVQIGRKRETYDAQKRVEHLRGIQEMFLQHMAILESINPKGWEGLDLNKELSKALSAVDDARAEYARSRAAVNAEKSEEVLEANPVADPYQGYSAQVT